MLPFAAAGDVGRHGVDHVAVDGPKRTTSRHISSGRGRESRRLVRLHGSRRRTFERDRKTQTETRNRQ